MIPKMLLVVLFTSVLVKSGLTLALRKHACKEYITGRDVKEYTVSDCLHAEVGYMFWDPMPSMKLHFPQPKERGQKLCFHNDEHLKVFNKNEKKIAGRRKTDKEWKRCISFNGNDIVLDCRIPAKYLKMKNLRYGTFLKFSYSRKFKKSG